ncbi:OmpA family protein [Piscinibacter sakaiensis]|uniref:OmpA family protein n=1 Tax=Piscinibacter sakaiensis TaxID=1547922 RepID=UPI003AB024C6
MIRYPQTLSLTAVVVLAVSCSLPVLRESPLVPAVRDEAAVPPSNPSSFVRVDFHRAPPRAGCPPSGCRKPTLKTLAVAHQPAADSSWQPQRAIAKLLNEPHSVAGPAAMTETAAAIAPQRRVPVEPIERELNFYFRYADATLAPDARDKLNDALRNRASLHRVSIRGRTDGLGASPANQRLALARANAVRQHLLSRDPSLATLIEVEARGSCCYVAPNATASGRALNRRVEITFVHQDSDA